MTAPWDNPDFHDMTCGEELDAVTMATGGLLPPREDHKLLVPLDNSYVLSAREVRALGHPGLLAMLNQLPQH